MHNAFTIPSGDKLTFRFRMGNIQFLHHKSIECHQAHISECKGTLEL